MLIKQVWVKTGFERYVCCTVVNHFNHRDQLAVGTMLNNAMCCRPAGDIYKCYLYANLVNIYNQLHWDWHMCCRNMYTVKNICLLHHNRRTIVKHWFSDSWRFQMLSINLWLLFCLFCFFLWLVHIFIHMCNVSTSGKQKTLAIGQFVALNDDKNILTESRSWAQRLMSWIISNVVDHLANAVDMKELLKPVCPWPVFMI